MRPPRAHAHARNYTAYTYTYYTYCTHCIYCTYCTYSGGSFTVNGPHDPVMQRKRMLDMAAVYLGSASPTDPAASPLLAPAAAFAGLPPTLVHVGDTEVRRHGQPATPPSSTRARRVGLLRVRLGSMRLGARRGRGRATGCPATASAARARRRLQGHRCHRLLAIQVLLDDSRTLEEKARSEGVQLEVREWSHVLHSWHTFYPIMPKADLALKDLSHFLREHLKN